jgi:uncharacterized membrane protein HdeD (DUF308 family)
MKDVKIESAMLVQLFICIALLFVGISLIAIGRNMRK